MALANVALTDTFDTWRVRTNQLIYQNEVTFSLSNNAFNRSNTAFDKANSANVLAYNTGIGSNAYAVTVGASGNAWANAIGTYSNSWANSVGTAGNNYTNIVGAAGNTYTNTVGAAGNTYTDTVGTAGNNYTNTVGAAGNTYTNAVGTAGNNYAIAVGASSNAWANTVGTAGNNYAIAVGASANAWSNTKISSVTGTSGQIFVSTGTTPTINLINTGVTAATYGGSVNAAIITIDSTGRVTAAANVTVGITVGNETANTSTFYPLLASVTSGTLTSSNVTTTKLYFVPGQGTLSATAFASLSDINLKENVTTIPNALGTIDNIQGVKFTWKDTQIPSYGVIAQNIEEFIPELVDNTNPENKTVNYDGLIAFLIESVKQLSDKINELEKKIT